MSIVQCMNESDIFHFVMTSWGYDVTEETLPTQRVGYTHRLSGAICGLLPEERWVGSTTDVCNEVTLTTVKLVCVESDRHMFEVLQFLSPAPLFQVFSIRVLSRLEDRVLVILCAGCSFGE